MRYKFLASGITLVTTNTVHDSCPCCIRLKRIAHGQLTVVCFRGHEGDATRQKVCIALRQPVRQGVYSGTPSWVGFRTLTTEPNRGYQNSPQISVSWKANYVTVKVTPDWSKSSLLRFSVTIVCIIKQLEHIPRFPSSFLTGHVLQTFLVSVITLVTTNTAHYSCPCDIRFTGPFISSAQRQATTMLSGNQLFIKSAATSSAGDLKGFLQTLRVTLIEHSSSLGTR
ncbi:hypothetical protein AVEN_238790-1 [Araneus ventricosus]|uniref:Uncharacterized protein n=1 Tax=Araneus ventricosus TaxID=182803 RepID=A0A4Y2ARE5_ARAVE|nr:hypothetical protein AVEN_238790-1 [Araneus ventricosus]